MPINFHDNRSLGPIESNSTFEYARLAIGGASRTQAPVASSLAQRPNPTPPIGTRTVNEILHVTDELAPYVRDRFSPSEGVYRLNDAGEYVSEQDWSSVWRRHPSWWQKAWMLADNGQYRASQVAAMSTTEIERAYDDPNFEPAYAYYTQADGDGLL